MRNLLLAGAAGLLLGLASSASFATTKDGPAPATQSDTGAVGSLYSTPQYSAPLWPWLNNDVAPAYSRQTDGRGNASAHDHGMQ